MGSWPRITKGLGRLTPERWGRIGRAVQEVELWRPHFPELTRRPESQTSTGLIEFHARITGTSSVEGWVRRWEYDWLEARLDVRERVPEVPGDPDSLWFDNPTYRQWLTPEGARQSTDKTRALNLTEAMNNATPTVGAGWILGGGLCNYEILPIRDFTVVHMTMMSSIGGPGEFGQPDAPRPTFSLTNPIVVV